MADYSNWVAGIEGNFPVHQDVLDGKATSLLVSAADPCQLDCHASRDQDHFSRTLGGQCMDKDRKDFSHAARWKDEEIFLGGNMT